MSNAKNEILDKKVRILHFSVANTKGGITQYILNQWKFIDKMKFQFDFVTFSKQLDFEYDLVSEGCKVYYVSTYAEQDERLFCEEIGEIFSHGYDVVHLHTSNWSRFLLEDLAKEAGIPKIIIHAHNSDIHNTYGKTKEDARKLHFSMREKLNVDVATDFWACSESASEWLYGNSIPKHKIVLLKNAVDINRFTFEQTKREQIRRELQIENDFVIGQIGRFEHQKNHEFMIRVFAELCKKVKDVKLLLIGDGSLRQKIMQMVEEVGIEENVIFLGKRDDIEKYYQAIDLFVLPSFFEGLCIAAVEAQVADLPCLMSENVDLETKITEKCELLELEEQLWYTRILELYKTRKTSVRQNRKALFTGNGFDIRDAIKILEELYLA